MKTEITETTYIEVEQRPKKIQTIVLWILAGVIFISGITVGLILPNTILSQKLGIATESNNSTLNLFTSSQTDQSISQTADFSVFWDVWNEIETKYVNKDLDRSKMVDNAIKGMVSSLEDPATIYLTEEETQQFDKMSAGEFEGIGAELGYTDGRISVKTPLKGSPAEAAGVRPGDIILKIDGTETVEMSITDAVFKIRGEKGTDVVLTVLSEGEDDQKDITITRDKIYIPSIEYKELSDGIYQLSVNRFTDDTFANFTTNIDEAMNSLAAKNPKRIIIDLRSNPGGFLDGAPYLAGYFLERDSLVLMTDSRDEIKKEFRTSREPVFADIPTVILVNGGTASASEIFAGALKFHKQTTIIGKQTVGKGTSQVVLDKGKGATLHLTIQKWLLPDESWLNPENPIVPDIEVDVTSEQFLDGIDPQLDKAVEEVSKI